MQEVSFVTIEEVGLAFRKRREERSMSLKEIENATSIRIPYLQAIENGTISQLISPVYARGFVKQYAHFLGIDGEAVCAGLPELTPPSEPQEFEYGLGSIEIRDQAGKRIKRLPNLFWAGVTVAVAIAAYYIARGLGII